MTHILSVLCLLLLVLVVLRLYAHRRYEGFESGGKNIVICKADWCGHCKTAAPEFEKMLSASPITLNNGSKATVKILDADKDKEELGKYKIKGFPSILIENGESITEYPGARTHDGVLQFLNKMK